MNVDLVLGVMAVVGAGVLGSLGPSVMALLPASLDAGPETPTYGAIARAPHLSRWLAIGAAALTAMVAVAVPVHLLLAWAVVCGVGIWLAYIDWRTNLLPTRIVWPLYVATVPIVALEAWVGGDLRILVRAVVTSLIAFCVFWVFWRVGELWRGGGFGYGDVRFAAPLGLVLGTEGGWAAPVGLYLGIVLAGIVGLVMKARGRGDAFALGPWMLLGAVVGSVVT